MSTNIEILEFLANQRPRIDREKGILYGVKFLGERSGNAPPRNNVYPRPMRESAIRVLEGARINIDHQPRNRDGEPRPYGDGAGVAKNLQEGGDGVYGEAHFNPRHPLWEQIVWDAENAPQHLGFSIHAHGDGRRENGQYIIESLTAVHSIDLVSRPATTGGLYESRRDTAAAAPVTTQGAAARWFGKDRDVASNSQRPRPARRRDKYRYKQTAIAGAELVEAVNDRLAQEPKPNASELRAILDRLGDATANLNNGICGPGVTSAIRAAYAAIERLLDGMYGETPKGDEKQFAESWFHGRSGNLRESQQFAQRAFGASARRAEPQRNDTETIIKRWSS